jgi:hypothetical protein
MKSKWSLESPIVLGAKTLLLGAIASALAYFTGSVLENLLIRSARFIFPFWFCDNRYRNRVRQDPLGTSPTVIRRG